MSAATLHSSSLLDLSGSETLDFLIMFSFIVLNSMGGA